MALYGTGVFGFQYRTNYTGFVWDDTPGVGEFNFTPSITDYVPVYDFNNTSVVRQESVINGHVEYIKRGNRQILKIDMHNVSSTQISQLNTALYKAVKFRPHVDNEDLEFMAFITKVTPYYLKNINSLDAVSFEIESQEFTELVVAD